VQRGNATSIQASIGTRPHFPGPLLFFIFSVMLYISSWLDMLIVSHKLVTAAFDDLWQVDSQLSASVGKKQPGKST